MVDERKVSTAAVVLHQLLGPGGRVEPEIVGARLTAAANGDDVRTIEHSGQPIIAEGAGTKRQDLLSARNVGSDPPYRHAEALLEIRRFELCLGQSLDGQNEREGGAKNQRGNQEGDQNFRKREPFHAVQKRKRVAAPKDA